MENSLADLRVADLLEAVESGQVDPSMRVWVELTGIQGPTGKWGAASFRVDATADRLVIEV